VKEWWTPTTLFLHFFLTDIELQSTPETLECLPPTDELHAVKMCWVSSYFRVQNNNDVIDEKYFVL
jgi:hypothetical protein